MWFWSVAGWGSIYGSSCLSLIGRKFTKCQPGQFSGKFQNSSFPLCFFFFLYLHFSVATSIFFFRFPSFFQQLSHFLGQISWFSFRISHLFRLCWSIDCPYKHQQTRMIFQLPIRPGHIKCLLCFKPHFYWGRIWNEELFIINTDSNTVVVRGQENAVSGSVSCSANVCVTQ